MFGGERAQSEVLGTVLLLGLTVAVVGTTVALGSAALDDSQRTADLQRVEGAMTQLDSKASLVAHGESPSQRLRMDVGRTADFRVDEDAGWMRIEVRTAEGTTNRTVPLGAVLYENGDETVAYQGGGVWRSNGDGARMVSPPEFHYRGRGGTETLTLPLVTIEDSGDSLGDSVRIGETGRPPDQIYPSSNGSNPLVGGNVTVTVESDYAEAWGRFFESRTTANVTELDDRRVEVSLRTETVHPTLSAGVSATGRSELRMGDVVRMEADSYNSTNGAYDPTTAGSNTTIQTRGPFGLTKGGGGGTESITIRGDLVAESYNIPPGQSDKLNVTGTRRTETAFGDLEPVEGAIRQRIGTVRELDLRNGSAYRSDGIDLSDDRTETIDENTYVDGDISVSGGATLAVTDGATLHVAGGLDVEGEDVDAGRVELDTSNGDVDVLFEESVDLSGDGGVRALGGGNATLYVEDSIDMQDSASITTANGTDPEGDTHLEIYNTGEIELDDSVNVTADGDVAGNLWLYSSADEIEIEGGDDGGGDESRVRFTGVFYAPQSDVELEDRMTIKGSFTFETFSFDDGDIELHYDEALRDRQPFGGDTVPVVSHLHVSTHGVVIESD